MGAVYACRHRNGSRVAIKVLAPRLSISPRHRERFLREGYVANRVNHAGVVPVFDDGVEEDGAAYLVMELLTGKNLATLAELQGGRLSRELVLRVAGDLLDVLVAAHGKGILHRDIKPENLFITDDGRLRVLDFGIARVLDGATLGPSTDDGTILGTPGFAAPEQARGRVDQLDARTDLWSVGATMFELLTGKPVYEAETPNEQLGLAMTTPPRSLGAVAPDLPVAIVEIVDCALAFNPQDRFQDARTMASAVSAVASGSPHSSMLPAHSTDRRPSPAATRTVSAALGGVAPRTWRWRERRPLLVFLGAALVAVSTWGAVQSLSSRSSSERDEPAAAAPARASPDERAPESLSKVAPEPFVGTSKSADPAVAQPPAPARSKVRRPPSTASAPADPSPVTAGETWPPSSPLDRRH